MARVTDLGQIPEACDDIIALLDEHMLGVGWLSMEASVHASSVANLLIKVRQVSTMLLRAEERAAWERIAAEDMGYDAEQESAQERFARGVR